MTTSFHALRGPVGAFLVLAAIVSRPMPARADLPITDAGTYRVYQNETLLGTEDFWFFSQGPRTLIRSRIRELLPRPGAAPDTLTKTMQITLGTSDHDLLDYTSQELLSGESTRRELAMEDTIYTSSRTYGQHGFSDVYVRPPGRIYPVDTQVFTLYHLMLRDVQQQDLDERGVLTLYLAGSRDTTAETRVKRLGKESVRLGGRVFPCDKFSVTDDWAAFTAWMSPSGKMLKFTLPRVGLRVERDPKTLSPKYAPSAAGSTVLPPPPVQVLR